MISGNRRALLGLATIALTSGLVSACSSSSTNVQPGPSKLPPTTASSSSAASSLAQFQSMTNQTVCALVPMPTIVSAMSVPAAQIHHDPAATDPGQCDWSAADGTHIDISFPAVTWAAAKQVIATRKISAITMTVGSHPAQSFPVFQNVTCNVALGADTDPILDIEAPNTKACESVATAALTSLHL